MVCILSIPFIGFLPQGSEVGDGAVKKLSIPFIGFREGQQIMGLNKVRAFNSLYWVPQSSHDLERNDSISHLSIPFIGFVIGLVLFIVLSMLLFQFPLLGSCPSIDIFSYSGFPFNSLYWVHKRLWYCIVERRQRLSIPFIGFIWHGMGMRMRFP